MAPPPPPPYDPYAGYPVAPVPMPTPAPIAAPSSYVPVQVRVAENVNIALMYVWNCLRKSLFPLSLSVNSPHSSSFCMKI